MDVAQISRYRKAKKQAWLKESEVFGQNKLHNTLEAIRGKYKNIITWAVLRAVWIESKGFVVSTNPDFKLPFELHTKVNTTMRVFLRNRATKFLSIWRRKGRFTGVTSNAGNNNYLFIYLFVCLFILYLI